MSKNEDYLDQLLKQLIQGEEKEDFSFDQMSQEMDVADDPELIKETKSQKENIKKATDEEEFIRQFEEEMDSFHSDKLISEYELLLDQELVGQEYEPEESENLTKNVPDLEVEPESEVESEQDLESEVVSDRSTLVQSGEIETDDIDSSFFQGLNQAMGKEAAVDSESESLSKEIDANQLVLEETGGLSGEDDSISSPTPISKPISLDNDEDILDLLSGLSDQDDELSDIANMLKADENHERIQADTGELINLEAEIADLSSMAKQETLDEDTLQSTKKGKKKKEKSKEKNKDNEQGFFGKLAKHFFGEDEEEGIVNPIVLTGDETLEELELLTELARNNTSPIDQEKAEKKQAALAKKEEKQKAANEKKQQKNAQKAEAKAKKQAKPPKEKVIDRSPKLPKVPVILIFVMAISTLILIILATNGSGYLVTKATALELYGQERYVESYSVIVGAKLKEEDAAIADKSRIMSSLQEEYNAYLIGFKHKDYEMGLDALIRGVGRYRDREKEIAKLGIGNEAAKVYGQLTTSLTNSYKLTVDEALKLYDIRKRNLYSVEIIKIIQSLNNPK